MKSPRRRTGNIRRAKPNRRYHDRRTDEERRKAPVVEPFKPVTARDFFLQLWASSVTGVVDGWTPSLADEDDAGGFVVFRDEQGTVKLILPRDVYDEVKKKL